MSRLIVLAALLAGVGATLVLSELRWFSRRPLAERIQPYVPGGWQHHARQGLLSVETFRDVVRPLAVAVGGSLGQVFGIREDLARRLMRMHSPLDPTSLRLRQLTWASIVFAASGALVLSASLPSALSLLLLFGGPLLAFLLIEQQVVSASDRWQRRIFLELPVVSEQIGMLLSAGYSLGGALQRISERGSGACAQDLRRVGRRVRQGLSEAEALAEWADLADVPALHRLVGVLTLNRDTGDLGRLIAEEARGIRREVHRQLITQIDRRSQQVWIPVTVATLVPGTMFMAVPFLQAMRLFGSS
jgi:Flp pilus assembly protein TadB